MPSRSSSRQSNSLIDGRSSNNEKIRGNQLRDIEVVSRANRMPATPSKDKRAKSMTNHFALPSDPKGSSLTNKQRQAIISVSGPTGIITNVTKSGKNNKNKNKNDNSNGSVEWEKIVTRRLPNGKLVARASNNGKIYEKDRSRDIKGNRSNSVSGMSVAGSVRYRNRSMDSSPVSMKPHRAKMQAVNFKEVTPKDTYIPKRALIYDYIDPRYDKYARSGGEFDESVYQKHLKVLPRIRNSAERLHHGLRWGSPLPPHSTHESFQIPYSVVKEWEMERLLTMPKQGPETVRERMLKYNYMLGIRRKRWILKHGKSLILEKKRPRSESPPSSLRYTMIQDVANKSAKNRSRNEGRLRSKSLDFYNDDDNTISQIARTNKKKMLRRMSLDSSQVYGNTFYDQVDRKRRKKKKIVSAENKGHKDRDSSLSVKIENKNVSANFKGNRSRDSSGSMKKDKKNLSAGFQRNRSRENGHHSQNSQKRENKAQVLSREQQMKLSKTKTKSEKLPLIVGDAGSLSMKKLKKNIDKSNASSTSSKSNKSQVRFERNIKTVKSKNRSLSNQSAKLSGDLSQPPFDYNRIREIDKILRLTKAYLENSVSQSSLASRTNSAKSFYTDNLASHAVN